MIKYKQVNAKNGRTMYYKNGRMVKEDQIPASILNNLEPGVELTTGSPDPDPETDAINTPDERQTASMLPGGTISPGDLPRQTVDGSAPAEANLTQDKSCIFCGEPGIRTRFINLATAHLCEDDYQNHTTGKIAAQMQKVST